MAEKNKSKLWFWLIVIIAAFAIYGTWPLVLSEYQQGEVCPKILGIPACYIVFICFLAALVSHVIPILKNNWSYFIPVGIVTLIATAGTFGELFNIVKCPRTSSGIPMCYISLTICATLLFLKYLNTRNRINV